MTLFDAPTLLETARARSAVTGSRLLMCGILMLNGFGLTGEWAPFILWAALTLATQALDGYAARRVLTKTADTLTRRDHIGYAAANLVAVIVFVSIAPLLWFGNTSVGQVIAVLFLSGGLLHVSLTASQNPLISLTSGGPYVVVLTGLILVAKPLSEDLAWPVVAAVTAAFAGYLTHLVKAYQLQRSTLGELHRALTEAEAQRRFAEERRQEAEAANRSKSTFLANMSHELRTPLNAIIGYSEILIEDAEAAGRAAEVDDQQRVLAAAQRLLRLINELLDLSKIEAGRMELEARAFAVEPMLADLAATAKPLLAPDVRFECALSSDLGEAYTDSFKLGQCVLNLLSNAAKFTREGAVRLEAHRLRRDGADWLEITVSDSGVGIAPERLDALFEPFVQADASTSRAFGGTGLGLAITRRIARLLGGDVTASSAERQGSRFTITVPCIVRVASNRRSDEPVGMPAAQQNAVLVIDDDPAACDLAQRALTRFGLEVTTAPTASAGLAQIGARKPALVLLDIDLPDQSGWSVLEALRDQAGAPPVVMMSVDDDRARSARFGAAAHLVKPVERDMLAATVLRLMRTGEDAPPAATPRAAVG